MRRIVGMAVPVIGLVMLVIAGPAMGEADVDIDDADRFAACETGTAARLRFVEDRLADGQRHGRYWWGGWLTFYSANVVVGSVRAGLEDDGGERASHIVNSVKALTGTTRQLLDRPTARLGADPVAGMPVGNEDECRRRLADGEDLLRAAAEEALERYDWRIHVGTVLFNVIGGVIVAVGFDEPDGWQSAGIGVVLGEVAHWSHPWRASADLDEYERRFPADGLPPGPDVSWHVAPTASGAALHVRF